MIVPTSTVPPTSTSLSKTTSACFIHHPRHMHQPKRRTYWCGETAEGRAFLCCTADLCLDVVSVWLEVMPASPTSTSCAWNVPLKSKSIEVKKLLFHSLNCKCILNFIFFKQWGKKSNVWKLFLKFPTVFTVCICCELLKHPEKVHSSFRHELSTRTFVFVTNLGKSENPA